MRKNLPFTSQAEQESKRSKFIPISIATTGVAVTGAAAALAMRRRNNKHQSAEQELITHVGDMMTLNSFVLGEIEGQLEDATLRERDPERELVEETRRLLMRQNEGLHTEMERLGGRMPSKAKGAAGAIVGMAASMGERMLYRGMQDYPISRMIRDNYTMLSAVAISLTMLHATARALHRQSLVEITETQMREAAELVIKMSQHIPRTVVSDVSTAVPDADESQSDAAVNTTRHIWEVAGQQQQ